MPNITSVTFEFHREHEKIEHKVFLYDSDDAAASEWLNQPDRDFNRLLQELVHAQDLTAGSVSVTWSDGIRALLPIPIKGVAPNLRSVGDLIACIVDLMANSEEFSRARPSDNMILQVAQRVGRLNLHFA